MIYRRLMKDGKKTELSDDLETRREVFRILEKFGPRDESEIAGKEFDNKGQINLIIKSLLIVIPLVGAGWTYSILAKKATMVMIVR